MRHNYRSSEDGNGTTPIVLFIVVAMATMIGYLGAYGEVFKPRQTPRVYVADSLDVSVKPADKR